MPGRTYPLISEKISVKRCVPTLMTQKLLGTSTKPNIFGRLITGMLGNQKVHLQFQNQRFIYSRVRATYLFKYKQVRSTLELVVRGLDFARNGSRARNRNEIGKMNSST